MTDIVIEEGDSFRMKAVVSDVCSFCKHTHDDPSHTCDAFPRGIPDEIWFGINAHTSAYPGDNGIQFEREPEPFERARRNLKRYP